jgi:hypothetical protein
MISSRRCNTLYMLSDAFLVLHGAERGRGGGGGGVVRGVVRGGVHATTGNKDHPCTLSLLRVSRVHVCVCVYVRAYVSWVLCVFWVLRVCVCVCVHVHVCVRLFVCVHMYVCVRV